jgi:quercetin dioxygenase-like cupin family protein
LRLALFRHPAGVRAEGPDEIVFEPASRTAQAAPATVEGEALRWALVDGDAPGALLSREVDLDPATGWLLRCDVVEFQPGGIAYRHTHPSSGIRYLLQGSITIDSEGERTTYGPGEPWFERGPDPVLAITAAGEPSAFVRVMLVPEALAGRRTITYVDPADADKPKTQRATILLETAVEGRLR